jgi:hypothetical protein
MPSDTDAAGVRELPRHIRFADAAALVLAAIAVWIALMGGRRYLFLGTIVSLKSPLPLVYAAVSVLIVRHLMRPRPNALQHLRATYASVRARADFAPALRAFLATRPAVLAIGFFAVITFGTSAPVGMKFSNDPLVNLPARFDAGWYGGIAVDGYSWDHTFRRQRNIAFFPAVPMLIRSAGTILGVRDPRVPRENRMLRALWVGVAISLAAFLWALYYLVRLGRDLVGAEAAANAALLLAAYPFALFFSAPYTESVYLLAAVGAFYHFRRGEWAASSAWGLLLGLTRPNGCFASVPLAILGLQQLWTGAGAKGATGAAGATGATGATGAKGAMSAKGATGANGVTRARWTGVASAGWKPIAVRLLTAAMPGIGMLLFTAYLYDLTGVWFAWARSHEAWGRTFQGLAPFATAFAWLRDEPLLRIVANVPYSTLNTIAVLFALALTYPVFRRLGAAWGVFVLINLVPPLFAGGVLSMGRLTATLFPLFLALAVLLPPRAIPAWSAGFGIAQGFCAALFFTWRELF